MPHCRGLGSYQPRGEFFAQNFAMQFGYDNLLPEVARMNRCVRLLSSLFPACLTVLFLIESARMGPISRLRIETRPHPRIASGNLHISRVRVPIFWVKLNNLSQGVPSITNLLARGLSDTAVIVRWPSGSHLLYEFSFRGHGECDMGENAGNANIMEKCD